MQPLKEVIRFLKAKKSLGQNFLTDPNILKRIVGEAGTLEDHTVIEIGPGPGGLTREIIKHSCKELILIEQDTLCLPYLDPLRSHFKGKFTLLNADVLSLSLHNFGSPPRKIIANLPYNISVPLLLKWLENIDDFESLTLMFQKEVAARLTAIPHTSNYGRLSVMCQWKANVKKRFDLPPGSFLPPPKVISTLVHLTPRLPRENVSWGALEKITKAAFSKRRKMLRSSLKGFVPFPQEFLMEIRVNPEQRAENLSVKEFCAMASLWEKRQLKND